MEIFWERIGDNNKKCRSNENYPIKNLRPKQSVFKRCTIKDNSLWYIPDSELENKRCKPAIKHRTRIIQQHNQADAEIDSKGNNAW